MEDFSIEDYLNEDIMWGGSSDLPEGNDNNEGDVDGE